jgi:tRNA 2-thiouridine synthesizing protein B
MADVFILTKPPSSHRSKICLGLIRRSEKPRLYLAGDGVYHLFEDMKIQDVRILASREDLVARGISPGEKVEVPDDFYADLVEDVMEKADRVYSF